MVLLYKLNDMVIESGKVNDIDTSYVVHFGISIGFDNNMYNGPKY
jgi:hypothetical protein